MLAIYEPIASHFERLADGPLLLTAYTLGYCVALPVVGPCVLILLKHKALGVTHANGHYLDIFSWDRMMWRERV